MKHLLLERKPTTETETEGFLSFPLTVLATIEQEWRPNPTGAPGGTPFNSCVPVGVYQLRPHVHHGKDVLALVNEDLGVYYLEENMPDAGGRFMVLIHTANWAHDVVGCIGPGLGKADSDQGPMVQSSSSAMKRIMEYVDGDDAVLEIRWIK